MADQTVTLWSSDGQDFTIAKSAAVRSVTIRNIVEDVAGDIAIPALEVDGAILAKVVSYLEKHAESGATPDELEKFDGEFFGGAPILVLLEVLKAANYLDIDDLLEKTSQIVADLIKNKSVEWVRKTFGITGDFTPEEEEQKRRESAWAFEGLDSDHDEGDD